MKKAVLKNFLNIHRKTFVVEPRFNKFAGLETYNLIKKDFSTGIFPVNTEKFLRTPILKNICKQLLLQSGSLS